MKKPDKYPRFNPETDGNYFEWIVRTTAMIRKKNINGQGANRRTLNLNPIVGRAPIRN